MFAAVIRYPHPMPVSEYRMTIDESSRPIRLRRIAPLIAIDAFRLRR